MQTDTAGLADPSRPGTGAGGNEPGGSGADRGKVTRGIARGALIVAALTAFSRVLGLLRTVVFAQTVGAGCLGTAYVTANQVPNLIVELAIGGALSSAMVPVLARSAKLAATDPREKRNVEQTSSALLTWSIVILLPVTLLITVTAGPISELLNPVNHNADCSHADMVNATSFMLISFAPQILLYGFSVVLFGLLQAYRKFGAVSLAPVIANVVTITSYMVFASLDQHDSLVSILQSFLRFFWRRGSEPPPPRLYRVPEESSGLPRHCRTWTLPEPCLPPPESDFVRRSHGS